MCRNRTLLLQAFCLVGIVCGAALAVGCDKIEMSAPGVEGEDASTDSPDSGEDDSNSSAGTSGSTAGSGAGASGKPSAAGSGGSQSSAGKSGSVAGSGNAAGAGAGAGNAGRGGAGAGGAGAGSAAGSGGSGAGSGGSGAGSGGSAAGSGGSAGGRCGTRGAGQCGTDEFCNFEPDQDCGATDRGGACEEKPQACTDIYKPVCGCDDHTYSSDCFAHAAGVSVKSNGMCGSTGGASGKTCGGIAALKCDAAQFCNYEEAAGGQGCGNQIADAAGKCDAKPSGCTRDLRPVCGCDHRTYNNACEAHAAGLSVLHDGGCTEKDCAAISGRVAYGLGPAPMCNADETEHGYLVADNGSMFIEGALCCLKR